MVNGEARDYGVEGADRGQRVIKIVGDDLDPAVCSETFVQLIQHRRREIDCDCVRFRASELHQRQQAASATAEIEDAMERTGQEIEEDRFAFGAMRNAIGALEVVQRMLRVFDCPEMGLALFCKLCLFACNRHWAKQMHLPQSRYNMEAQERVVTLPSSNLRRRVRRSRPVR